jgi:drug/metabolite transporter (DMT)-like permease
MVLWLVVRVEPNVTTLGLTLAVVSGIVTSGLGYFLWFLLLPSLSSSSAAAFQLSVPVVVAFLGIVFLDELLSLQVILASAIVLSGLGLFTYAKLRKNSESYAP